MPGDGRAGGIRWELEKDIKKLFRIVYEYVISIVVVSQMYTYVKT